MFEVSTASFKLQHQPPVALFEKSFTALSIDPGEWASSPGRVTYKRRSPTPEKNLEDLTFWAQTDSNKAAKDRKAGP